MELLVVVLVLLALAVAAPLFGADTRASGEWSLGAVTRPAAKSRMRR